LFQISFTQQALDTLERLRKDQSQKKRYRAVAKALALLANDPRHPGLQTHEFVTLSRARGIKIYEAYAENNTPAAYRIFWHYGPGKEMITISSITQHPS
jgi:hypothetical protein